MIGLPLFALGGRGRSRPRVKVGPSNSGQLGMALLRLIGRAIKGLFYTLPIYSILYWYVSLPIIGIALIGWFIYWLAT